LVSVLKLSSQWDLIKARTWSITQLNRVLDPSEKVELGQQFGVANWVREGYIALVKQEEPMEKDAWRRLGLATVTKLAEARESRYKVSYAQYQSRNSVLAGESLPNHIEAYLGMLPPPDSTPSDLVSRIKLAKEGNMQDVLRHAYIALVERPSSLTLEEVEKLGEADALQIMHARLLLRKDTQGLGYHDNWGFHRVDSNHSLESAQEVVGRVFLKDLLRARVEEANYKTPKAGGNIPAVGAPVSTSTNQGGQIPSDVCTRCLNKKKLRHFRCKKLGGCIFNKPTTR
jgi:hypothetical protein